MSENGHEMGKRRLRAANVSRTFAFADALANGYFHPKRDRAQIERRGSKHDVGISVLIGDESEENRC